jgi:uncharacterized membrane protein
MKKWLPQIGLLALFIIPAIGSVMRLHNSATAEVLTQDNARYLLSPTPILIHIASSLLFGILGAFQFAPSLRRGRENWHKKAGKVLLPAGFGVALSGLWMTAFYPWPEFAGLALNLTRWAICIWMLATLIMAIIALRARNFVSHGNWMVRTYAVFIGGGTQALVYIPWLQLVDSEPNKVTHALLMGGAWLFNILFAEWLINRKARNPRLSVSIA